MCCCGCLAAVPSEAGPGAVSRPGSSSSLGTRPRPGLPAAILALLHRLGSATRGTPPESEKNAKSPPFAVPAGHTAAEEQGSS
jgi:hypothetical protein